jgi:hypothetical protein
MPACVRVYSCIHTQACMHNMTQARIHPHVPHTCTNTQRTREREREIEKHTPHTCKHNVITSTLNVEHHDARFSRIRSRASILPTCTHKHIQQTQKTATHADWNLATHEIILWERGHTFSCAKMKMRSRKHTHTQTHAHTQVSTGTRAHTYRTCAQLVTHAYAACAQHYVESCLCTYINAMHA